MTRMAGETRVRGMVSLLLALAASMPSLYPAAESPPLLIESHRLVCAADHSTRTLRVARPGNAVSAAAGYPLLLVLDGDDYFAYLAGVADILARSGVIPRLLVVSVDSPRRWTDFTPTPGGIPGGAEISGSGGARSFLDCLKSDILPFLESRYPILPFRILAGHSLSGLFAVYAFAAEEDLFQACLATSPSLWWNDGGAVDQAVQRLSKPGGSRQRFLFTAMGGEGPTMEDPWRRLRTELPPRVGFLDIRFTRYDEPRHQLMPLRGFPPGLEFIFARWTPPKDLLTGGLTAVKAFYAGLSRTYGFAVLPPETTLNRLGYMELKRHHLAAALEAFRLNVRLRPDSANCHDSLAEALDQAGRLEDALAGYLRARELDPLLPGIDDRIREIRRRLSASETTG